MPSIQKAIEPKIMTNSKKKKFCSAFCITSMWDVIKPNMLLENNMKIDMNIKEIISVNLKLDLTTESYLWTLFSPTEFPTITSLAWANASIPYEKIKKKFNKITFQVFWIHV